MNISEQVAEFTATGGGINCEVIHGPAGSGKSWTARESAAGDPNYAKVTAVTGIAAVNLGPGVSTINSTLGFYNEESAFDALGSGRFRSKFRDLAKSGYKNLLIDEVSMMSAGVLTAIVLGAMQGAEAVQEMNNRQNAQLTPTGLILMMDFLQLGPIKAPYAFTADVWSVFERSITRLDKIHRQANPAFVSVLQSARAGHGTTAAMGLKQCGAEFVAERDDFFDGTSLVPTNDMANKINAVRYQELDGVERVYNSCRWGRESGEWKDIPEQLNLKDGAFVMVLANQPRTFEYVNGDQGVVVEMREASVVVEIRRGTARTMQDIPFVWRETTQKDKPEEAVEYKGYSIDGFVFATPRDIERQFKVDLDSGLAEGVVRQIKARRFARFFEQYDAYTAEMIKQRLPYFSVDKNKWVIGWVEYMPVRLAYSSTIHKVQGLTLDRIQIDARSRFAGNPGMMYVALSRCRTPENIRIVASIGDFARRIQTVKECLRWV